MAAFRLLAALILYYGLLAAVVAVALWLSPSWGEYLPIGRVQSLIAETGGGQLPNSGTIQATPMMAFGPSLVWLATAVFGALLAALPVSWVYIRIPHPSDSDQSLPFSLAGIAGAPPYRNSLKSSGDLLFILLAIGIGLAAGIGAVELAMV